jgi:glyoxylase-like metal-dependent hydrolase (beta-lactamase superfamily II)
MQLINNLYAYTWNGRGNNCHSFLFHNVLSGERPHVMVDPGYDVNEIGEKCFERLTGLMRSDGIEVAQIGLVINTHSHVDHCGASELIAGTGPVRGMIAISEIEDEYRRGTGLQLHRMMGLKLEDFEPDFFLAEGFLKLNNGKRKFDLQVIHTPGHCPGSISIYDPQNKALITGDAVFNRSVGRTDFPGGDGKALKASIEKLAEFDAEYLLPGHSTEYGNIIHGRKNVSQNFAFIKRYYFPML